MKLKNDNETEDQKPEERDADSLSEEETVEVEDESRDDAPVADTEQAEESANEVIAESLEVTDETAVEDDVLETEDFDITLEQLSEDDLKTEPNSDEPIANDDAEDDSEPEAAVEFEGDRPLVKELVYQAPRGNQTKEEQEEAEALQFASVAEAKSVVEGFLFSCNEPLTVSKLSKLMNNLHPKSVRGLLLELQWDYENRPGALQVVEIAGGYQMCTRAHVAPWMFRMHKHKRRSALSPATLETLAIVAYRQPITKGEIETIRGVESGAPLRTLQDLNLVEASGRREVIGRPQLYVTTEQFLKAFGLKSVADLPSISELKSRFAEEQKLKRTVAEEPKPQPVDEVEDTAEESRPEVESEEAGEDIEAGLSADTSEDSLEGVDAEPGDLEMNDEGINQDPAESEQDPAEPEIDEDDVDLDDLDEIVEDDETEPKGKRAQGSFEEEDSLDVP